jgi:hypothetical protein
MAAAEFHVRASPLRYAGLLVVSLLLALGGWMLLSEPGDWSDRLVGWLLVLFFGGTALLMGFLGARILGRPLLSVGPMGIRVWLTSPLAKAQEVFVPWEHITAVEFHPAEVVGRTYKVAQLAIVLKDPEAFAAQTGIQSAGERLGTGLSEGRLWVSFGYVRRPNRTGQQVLEAIRQLPAAAHVQLGEG